MAKLNMGRSIAIVASCSIFTNDEEESIVKFVKNKNRSLQGITRTQLAKIMLDVLRVRDHLNRKCKGGRKFVKLTPQARRALSTGKLGQSFWSRFDAKHSTLVIKHQGHVSVNRALNCTRQMACKHLDELAKELIAAKIMTNAEKIDDGVWNGDIDTSRIFNNDETPQFVNYGVDGTAAGLREEKESNEKESNA